MKKIKSNIFSPDGKYEYIYWTEGISSHPPLVLIPGFTGTHGDLLDFAKQFKEKYFVIIPDLPGWGDSPKGTYHLTIEGYARFISDLLEFLSLHKITLVGHCMGSAISIEFANTYPEKVSSLFLIGIPYLKDNFSDALFQHLAHVSIKVPKIFRPFFFFFRSRLLAIPSGLFVIQTKSLRKKLSIILHNSIKQQFQDEDLVEKNWNSLVLFHYNKLKKMSLPIHIFHGEKDLLVQPVQAEKIAKLCKNGTLDLISHAGHMPPVESPVGLAHAMNKYL